MITHPFEMYTRIRVHIMYTRRNTRREHCTFYLDMYRMYREEMSGRIQKIFSFRTETGLYC
jgi:hypothetical protein